MILPNQSIPPLFPAKAGIQPAKNDGLRAALFICWVPAFAGMSGFDFISYRKTQN